MKCILYEIPSLFLFWTVQEIAGETKREVQKQKAAATAKANEAQAIADSAQRDLNEALPALVRHWV